MANLAVLDKYVKEELKKIGNPNGFNILFYHSESNPGQGYFTVKNQLNGADFEYRREFGNKVYVNLIKDGDSIVIHTEQDKVAQIRVNDRRYENPEFSIGIHMTNAITSIATLVEDNTGQELRKQLEKGRNADQENEVKEALEFGQRAVRAVYSHISGKVPGLGALIKGYYSRSLPVIENDPDLRTNSEIFAKFNLY
jgi:hypothetical protein